MGKFKTGRISFRDLEAKIRLDEFKAVYNIYGNKTGEPK